MLRDVISLPNVALDNDDCLPRFGPDAELDVDLSKRIQAALVAAAKPKGMAPQLRQRLLHDGRRSHTLLIRRHLRLTLAFVGRYSRALHTAGLSKDDGFEAALSGLAHALIKFDPGRGYLVSTYVTYWIRQTLNRTVRYQRPAHAPDSWWKLYNPDGRPPSRTRRGRQLRTRSLDATYLPGDTRTLLDQTPDLSFAPEHQTNLLDSTDAEQLLQLLPAEIADLCRTAAEGDQHLRPSETSGWLQHPAVAGRLMRDD